jgi:histidinol-phosphatase (PHP family)
MKFSNFHTHSNFCDGAESPEEYVKQALLKEMASLGFSGHAPVPFPSTWNMPENIFGNYIADIQSLQAKYRAQIPIFLGAEIDYIRDIQSAADFQKYHLNYIISAIHYLNPQNEEIPWDFIISPSVFRLGLKKYFENDIKKLIKLYYTEMNLMIEKGGFDIVAHIDQIGKFNQGNQWFSEQDTFYKNSYKETIELCAEKNIIIEINTRGRLKNLTENYYPSGDFIKECRAKNVQIILSADAHRPQEVDSFLPEALHYIKNLGYKEIMTLKDNKFSPVEI